MEDLRQIALGLWGSGDHNHATQLRDQIKIWQEDPTWPQRLRTPSIQFEWLKLDEDVLNQLNIDFQKIDQSRMVSPDLLTVRGSTADFFVVNFSFELALTRLMQRFDFPRIVQVGGFTSPVSIWGRPDFYKKDDPSVLFSGFNFPRYPHADIPMWMYARKRLIEETNTILPLMDKPIIPPPPFFG